MVRVVALDALQANQLSLRRIPMAVDAAMRTVLPIPVHGAMTLGAQFRWLIPGNFLTKIVNEGLSIRRVVAIEASRVDAVLQPNLRVLGKLATGSARLRMSTVAFAAPIRESADAICRLPRRLTGRCRVRRRRGHRCRRDHRTLITRGKHQRYVVLELP